MPLFADILDTPIEDIKRASAFPVGHYLIVQEGPPVLGKTQKGGESLAVKLKIIRPMEDVDRDAITTWQTEAKETLAGQFFAGTSVFYAPAWNMIRGPTISEYFQALGLPGSMSTRQALSESSGRQCIVNNTHAPSQDGKSMVNQIKDVTPC